MYRQYPTHFVDVSFLVIIKVVQPFRFGCHGIVGGAMLFVREDIPVKQIGSGKLSIESV